MALVAVRFGIATGAYVEERNDWHAAVSRAAAERWPFVELTAIFEERLDSLATFVRETQQLDAFERVSIHAPIVWRTSRQAVVRQLVGLESDGDLIFHPDVYHDEDALQELRQRVVFENMDVGKSFGRFAADLSKIFDRYPQAGFCLDVAHVWTNDNTLRLGAELLDAFGARLRQLHVSGIDAAGVHRPTSDADLAMYEPLLERCRHVPWVLEAELVHR